MIGRFLTYMTQPLSHLETDNLESSHWKVWYFWRVYKSLCSDNFFDPCGLVFKVIQMKLQIHHFKGQSSSEPEFGVDSIWFRSAWKLLMYIPIQHESTIGDWKQRAYLHPSVIHAKRMLAKFPVQVAPSDGQSTSCMSSGKVHCSCNLLLQILELCGMQLRSKRLLPSDAHQSKENTQKIELRL